MEHHCVQEEKFKEIDKTFAKLSENLIKEDKRREASYKMMDHLMSGISNNAEHIGAIRENVAVIDQRTSQIEKKLNNGISDKLREIAGYVEEQRKKEEIIKLQKMEEQRKLDAEAADRKKRVREAVKFLWQSSWKYFIRFVAAYAALKLFGVDPLDMLK